MEELKNKVEEIKQEVKETADKVVEKKPRWITKVGRATKESLHDTKESLKKNKGKIALAALAAVPVVGGAAIAFKVCKDNEEDAYDSESTAVETEGFTPVLDEVIETD